MASENIAAISTALSASGVAVIRISGDCPLDIAEKMFTPVGSTGVKAFEPYKLYVGEISADGFTDFGMCVYFKGPKSFTGEDVVEFHSHGGVAITRGILKKILSSGARLATNGEFTKRAFMNGKLSLSSAEGLIDMINSESVSGVKAGYYLYREKLTRQINRLQDILTDSGVSVEPGNVIVIPPDTPWRFFCTGKHIYFYCVHFTGSQAKNVLDEFGIKIFPEMNRISVDNELQKRFHRLFDAFGKKDEFRHKDLVNYLNGIFIETARAIEYDRFDKIILSKSIRYINAFYTTGIKISDLAKMENMCVTLYNKHFKSIMKTTPTKYIMTLRIHYACELISNSDMQINEIAANCGYKDANFFIRVFKKCVGQTPLAYKKSILSN